MYYFVFIGTDNGRRYFCLLPKHNTLDIDTSDDIFVWEIFNQSRDQSSVQAKNKYFMIRTYEELN